MSDDLQYGSRSDGKRKFDSDSHLSPAASSVRSTGFSAPIVSPHKDSQAPSSYNSVPPPLDEFQLAKQRAQEIAARLFSSAEAKRPRVENGGSDESGDHIQKPSGLPISSSLSGSHGLGSQTSSYGYHGTSKKIDVPNGRVGVIIGKSGETIKYLQLQSGAKIQVTRDMDADPNAVTRSVELTGTPEQITKAEQLISDVLAEAEAGGSGILSARRFNTATPGTEQFVMKVPNNKVGLIIGKGGESIKNMQSRSGARIQIIPLHLPPGDPSNERTVQIDGTKEQLEIAKQLVNEVISDNRGRNPSMGGYNQQGYQQPRPPTSWGPPGHPPMQQPGYGYMQPGAYPGPPPQYNMPQPPPPYGGYAPQQTSTGYSSGWDQSSGAPGVQGSQGGGYDYYNQQQQPATGGSAPPATPNDGSAYPYGQAPPGGYNQQPTYGESGYTQQPAGQSQAYGQDAYGGGYQGPGYGQQAAPNVQPGYDQYNSASSYGSKDGSALAYGSQAQAPPSQTAPPASQPPAGGAPPPQSYTSQPPSTAPSYPSQVSGQPGYGAPPSQPGYPTTQPPAQPAYGTQPGYGQSPSSQKPTSQAPYGQTLPPSQGSYPAATQPGYAHTQPGTAPTGYAQPQDASYPRAGATTYGSAQGAYGQQPYGAPASQPAYGQQPYGDSYNGYSQPPPYSTDGSASGGGSAHGGYDAGSGAPPAVKASPQNQG